MSRPASTCAWIVAIAAGVLCAGCQSAAPDATTAATQPLVSASPSPSPSIVGPVLSGTVSISGAATIPATPFTVGAQAATASDVASPPPGATCADYARGFSSTRFAAPMLQTSGDHNIYVDVSMASGYRGPGTYDNVHDPSLTGTAVEGIGSGTAAVYTVFHSKDSGTITLSVHSDGSGSLSIAHWDTDEVRQTPGPTQVAIEGTVTWTCSDA